VSTTGTKLVNLGVERSDDATRVACRISRDRFTAAQRLDACAAMASEVSWQAFSIALARSRRDARKMHSVQHGARLRDALRQVQDELQHLCRELEIQATVSARIKDMDSICRKMRLRQITYRSIFDLAGVRAIVSSSAECYRLLASVHRSFTHVPGHVRDYIARPKVNGYRSLHTTVLNREGIPIEVQLRTPDMDRQAIHGRGALRSYDSEPASERCDSAPPDRLTQSHQPA
jgi:(p)ppGpp synthase/HD superfamily hydrolase